MHGDERLAYRAGSTTEDQAPLGSKLIIEDGRTFRMAQCDTSTALVVGRLSQSPVPANTVDEEVDAIAAGVRVLTDPGTTVDLEFNDLRNGYFMVDEPAQLDPLHQIEGNTGIRATDADQAAIPTITLVSGMVDAIGGSETISYIHSPYRQIVIHDSPPTALMVGVPVQAMAVNVYGWIATGGPTRVLQDGALVVGGGTSASTAVDGSVIAWVPETGTTVNPMYTGTALFTNPTTTRLAIVFLRGLDSS